MPFMSDLEIMPFLRSWRFLFLLRPLKRCLRPALVYINLPVALILTRLANPFLLFNFIFFDLFFFAIFTS
jgi:hypothetical protein